MSVKHLSVAINKWKYRLQYPNYFGGVSAISKIHFKRVCNSNHEFLVWLARCDFEKTVLIQMFL